MSLLTKKPTHELLEAWIARVLKLGGRAGGICRGRDLAYEIGTATRHVHSCCCGAETKADIPYQSGLHADTTFYARVCAVCDAAVEFPRLK